MTLKEEIKKLTPEVVRLRRLIHQYPERGFQEEKTASLIEKQLSSYGIQHKRLCKTGVVGLIKGGKPGPTILFRADMDGLPVAEENDLPYKSKIPGVMHA
ncbi:MAG: hypothetical protein QF645_02030 [Planctomycetota bacterium]|nr:hypothetical protein [Planctomycetota bacterium]